MIKDKETRAAAEAEAMINSRAIAGDPDGIDRVADGVLRETSALPDPEYGLLVAAELRIIAHRLRSAERAHARLGSADQAGLG